MITPLAIAASVLALANAAFQVQGLKKWQYAFGLLAASCYLLLNLSIAYQVEPGAGVLVAPSIWAIATSIVGLRKTHLKAA